MNETPWQRLHRLAYARIDHLGTTQADLHSEYGGPSPAWVRKIKDHDGPPSTRETKSLEKLSRALGWSDGMARSLLVDDRTTWPQEVLDEEEQDLVYGDDLPAVEQKIRDFQTMVAARLRVLAPEDRQAAMDRITALLGMK